MTFGKRALSPHPLAKRIKVSQQLLRQALIGPEGLVIDRLGYKFAVAQEKAFLTGSGVGRPLGVYTERGPGIADLPIVPARLAGIDEPDVDALIDEPLQHHAPRAVVPA